MIDRAALEALSVDELRGWVLRRMHGEEFDPPLDALELESPEDFVLVAHEQTADMGFRARLERTIVDLLGQISGSPDLADGADAREARALAAAAQAIRLGAAETSLRTLALRGHMGGRGTALDAATEDAVLAALAIVQKPGILRDAWLSLWQGDEPKLWTVALAGLRRSDPNSALARLREVLRRAQAGTSLPEGELLWAFRIDPNIGDAGLARVLAALGPTERARCRQALEEIGASSEVLNRLFDDEPRGGTGDPGAGGSGDRPDWALPHRLARHPPRLWRRIA